MDATAEFLSIVNCRPDEVQDMTEDELARSRRHALKQQFEKPKPLFKGGPVLNFGMHKGKHASEVPRDYLKWLVDQEPSSRRFAVVQLEIRRFMGWE